MASDIFLYFYLGMIIDSQEDCKNSTEGSHIPFTQFHPVVISSITQGVVLKPSVTTARLTSHLSCQWQIL